MRRTSAFVLFLALAALGYAAYTTPSALRTEINTRIPDNQTRAITAADIREPMLAAVDYTASVGGEPETFTTQVVDLVPPAAITPEGWRYVRHKTFYGGLTMDDEQKVIFENCEFGDGLQLTGCSQIVLRDCRSNGSNRVPGALWLDDCQDVTIENLVVTNANYHGLQISSDGGVSERITVRDSRFQSVTQAAPPMVDTLVRNMAFENTTNVYVPGVTYGAVLVKGSKEVCLDNVYVDLSARSGIVLRGSERIEGINCRVRRSGSYDPVSPVLIQNDAPLVIYDCQNVTFTGGYFQDGQRMQVLVKGYPLAFDSDDFTCERITLQNVLIQGYSSNDFYDAMLSRNVYLEYTRAVQINGCDIRYAGEAGVMVNARNDYPQFIGNYVHDNGLSTGVTYSGLGLVHYDGFETIAARMPTFIGNYAVSNERDGMRFKASDNSAEEDTLSDVILVANVTAGNGGAQNGTKTIDGVGLTFDSLSTCVREPVRATVLGHVAEDNNTSNVVVWGGWSQVELFGLHANWTDHDNNINLRTVSDVDFYGGFMSGWRDSQNYVFIAQDNGDGLSYDQGVHDARLFGTRLYALDYYQENRRAMRRAFQETAAPSTDTFAEALATASAVDGETLYVYDAHAQYVPRATPSATSVMALQAGTGAPQTIPDGSTNDPSVVSTLQVAVGDATPANILAGSVVVNGTNFNDQVISETFVLAAGTATQYYGRKSFKTVTTVDLPAEPATTGISVGVGFGHRLAEQSPEEIPVTSTGKATSYTIFLDESESATTTNPQKQLQLSFDNISSRWISGNNQIYLWGDDIVQPPQFVNTKGSARSGLSSATDTSIGNGWGPVYRTTNDTRIELPTAIDLSDNVPTGGLIANVSGDLAELHVYTRQTEASGSITSTDNLNPVEVTTSGAHNLTTGQSVEIRGVSTMTQLNNRKFVVTVTGGTTFTLDGENGTTYTDGTGGTFSRRFAASINAD